MLLFVDQNPELQDVEPVSTGTIRTSKADWQPLWRPIIQNGKYVGD